MITNSTEYLKNTYLHLFIYIFLISAILFVVFGVCFPNIMLNQFYLHTNAYFSDFFDSIVYSCDYPYTKYTIIYPPMVTIAYDYLAQILIYLNVPINASVMRMSQGGLGLYLTILGVTLSALFVTLNNYLRRDSAHLFISIILLCSFPIVYGVERGNNIIVVLLLLLLFAINYNSNTKIIQILAYISLAIAIGIKIYVALFALVLLRDRNYRGLGIIYSISIVIFFGSFLLTDGNSYILLHNIYSYLGGASIEAGSFYNIRTMLNFFDNYITYSTKYYLQYIIFACLYVSTIIVLTFSKHLSNWEIWALICSSITLGLGTNAMYNYCIFIIPFIVFLIEAKDKSIKNNIFFILFTLIFIWIPAPTYLVGYVQWIHCIPVLCIFMFIQFEQIINRYKNKHSFSTGVVQIKKKTIIVSIVIAVSLATITIMIPLIHVQTYNVDNNGTNTLEIIGDTSIQFTFDPQRHEYTLNGVNTHWASDTDYLLTTEMGYITSTQIIYYDGSKVIQLSINHPISVSINNKVVTITINSSIISWAYQEYLLIKSSYGEFVQCTIADNAQVFLKNSEAYSCVLYEDTLISTSGTKIYENGMIDDQEVSFKKYDLFRETYTLDKNYEGVWKLNENTSIIPNSVFVKKTVTVDRIASNKNIIVELIITTVLILVGIFSILLIQFQKSSQAEYKTHS